MTAQNRCIHNVFILVVLLKMIPSVQERKKYAHHFMNSYPYICRLQNTIPNPHIKVDSSVNVLDFVGDRLKLEDWKPLLEALSNDRSLHCIKIRSRHSKTKVLQKSDKDIQCQEATSLKSSPLSTNSLLFSITEALSKCMINSTSLTGLTLEKISLDLNLLNHLLLGLEECRNLQQLALPYTQVGDDGCAALCQVLRQRLNLIWLNLTACGLTDKGVSMLCNLLKFQKLNRYGESWKQSLRYRPVNPNVMPGLRRLTLNYNPIGDNGIKIFVEVLTDDLWLKALDLQQCGVSLMGAEALLSLVKENRFLSVVDVRGNLQVPSNLVAAIVQQLAENNSDTIPEFQWLDEDNTKNNLGSNCGTSLGRSTQRSSNTRLPSKTSLISVLPNKTRISRPTPSLPIPRSRSASVKRSRTTNNTPRPPWNWNYSNTSLKRGNSDQLLLSTKVKHNQQQPPLELNQNRDILDELQSVKKELLNVSRLLQDETKKRIQLEHELEKCKRLMRHQDTEKSLDNIPPIVHPRDSTLQTILHQAYNDYLPLEMTGTSKPETAPVDDEVAVQQQDSLESVIQTINGELHPCLKLDLHKSTSSTNHIPDDHDDIPVAPSRAQLLFETLLSS